MYLPETNRLEIRMNERREEKMLVRAIEEEIEFVLQLFFSFLIQTQNQQVLALSSVSFSRFLTVWL